MWWRKIRSGIYIYLNHNKFTFVQLVDDNWIVYKEDDCNMKIERYLSDLSTEDLEDMLIILIEKEFYLSISKEEQNS